MQTEHPATVAGHQKPAADEKQDTYCEEATVGIWHLLPRLVLSPFFFNQTCIYTKQQWFKAFYFLLDIFLNLAVRC